MSEEEKKNDAMIRACKINKEDLIKIGRIKGVIGLYDLRLENMYDYLMKDAEARQHGSWEVFDECSNADVCCSVCYEKACKTDYSNRKLKPKYYPNCGVTMDLFPCKE